MEQQKTIENVHVHCRGGSFLFYFSERDLFALWIYKFSAHVSTRFLYKRNICIISLQVTQMGLTVSIVEFYASVL